MSTHGLESAFTGRVRAFALAELGADLVGFANLERFAHAPAMMSPQGLLPTTKSVIVMAIHHPDAAIELGGETHPQEIGPYRVQYQMNCRLDDMAYRLAVWLERTGWAAMPIVSSNIWRYKGYKDLTEHFAPDMSHRHSAVAAGLADFGYSALAITPEYGARQRFITVLTDAELTPTPLLEPGSVCDDCRLCQDMCPTQALTKEIRGTSQVRIEDKVYTYADKNLWRCAWGEHFDLDVDLPIPDVVDEAVILQNVAEHGRRGGEMGCCLRYCVPLARRVQDPGYTSAPRRLRATPDPLPNRIAEQEALAHAWRQGVDFVSVLPVAEVRAAGVDPETWLPGAQSLVTVGFHFTPPANDPTGSARRYLLDTAAYDVARALERQGWDSVSCTDLPESVPQALLQGVQPGRRLDTATVLTTAPLPASGRTIPGPVPPRHQTPDALRAGLEQLLREAGADLVGVSPAARLESAKPQVAAAFDGREVLVARDTSGFFQPYEPEIRREVVQVKGPEDHLPGALSVLVIGLRLPRASVERLGLPPAEAIGPYAFAQYEATNQLRRLGFRALRWLQDAGYSAALTFDLMGTGSLVGNPRGEQPDAFCNRFAAVAAGLARLTRAGFPTTPSLGPNVRFVALVTDADLAPNATLDTDSLTAACADCRRCLDACHTDAFEAPVAIAVDGVTERFNRIERNRCDWAKRYSLIGEEGVNLLGWDLHLEPPPVITLEALADGVRQQPTIPKYRPCNFEACLLACPLAR